MPASRKTLRPKLGRIVLPLAAALCIAAAGHSLSGIDAPGMGATAEVFLGRLQAALTAFSKTSIRTQRSGQTVFFDSTKLPTAAGNLAFAGHFILDPTGRAFDGVLERFYLNGGRTQFDLRQPARIHCTPDGTLSIADFEADGPYGRISANGSISREGKFDVVVGLAGVDLQTLSPFLAPALTMALDAELNLQGDWESLFSDTGPTVDVILSGGKLLTGSGIPPLESINLKARQDGRSLEIQSFEGLLGGAPFRLTGRIENPATLSENGWFDLSLSGDNLLLYRSEEIRLRAEASLRLVGPFSRLELSGALSITHGRYEKNFDLTGGIRGVAQKSSASPLELFSIRSQPFRDAIFDVAVTATNPFEIKNNRLRAAARSDLRFTGTGEKPILTGRVFFEPSTVYLPGGRIQFDPGVVRFQPPDPGRPLLEFNGHGRLQGYDVVAVVEGPYDQPTVTLSSTPVLTNEELLLLVLSGQSPKPRRTLDSERSRNLDVAFFLGKDMMSRIEGPRSNDTTQSIMDRFDVDIGRNATRSGDETVCVLFRVADSVFREGDTLSLAGEKDSYGYYNGGVRIAFRFR
jgi:TamB, inner membrane protein subunit of TAM complex